MGSKTASVLLLLLCVAGRAQECRALTSGQVTDSSEAAVPNAGIIRTSPGACSSRYAWSSDVRRTEIEFRNSNYLGGREL
jgi:hypothetical protein